MDWNKNPTSDGRVKAVCIWGPDDANTWIKTENTPLLYDTNHQPKLAYTTLTSMIPYSFGSTGCSVVPGLLPSPHSDCGIGMQSHINADYDGFSGVSAYTTAMKKFLSIGSDVQITELDITMENGKYTDRKSVV